MVTFHVYKARDGWRWRLKARNGRIIADGGEAYSRKSNAKAAAENVIYLIFKNEHRVVCD